MTGELLSIVAHYRAGLEAEMALLQHLDNLSEQQRQATLDGDFDALSALDDVRDGALASLVTIEHQLKPLRQRLFENRERLAGNAEFEAVVIAHREAAALVTTILVSDRTSLDALKDAELVRRTAAAAMEKGESTLAAYRRVIAPGASNATLVDTRG
jgi:hypothetical protein